MTDIIEYNIATGHTETVATVRTDRAEEMIERLWDGSTDHVLYARIVM